jgi:hypothetical protein
MRRLEIHRAVARATGESPRTISRRGFSLDHGRPQPCDDLQFGLDCPGCGQQLLLDPRPLTQQPGEVECPRCDAIYDIHPEELHVVAAPATLLG